MSRTIMALPSVLAFFESDVDVEGLVLEVGLDLEVVFCGQLAAQWPGWPHFRHLDAACPRWMICPPLVCHVDGPFHVLSWTCPHLYLRDFSDPGKMVKRTALMRYPSEPPPGRNLRMPSGEPSDVWRRGTSGILIVLLHFGEELVTHLGLLRVVGVVHLIVLLILIATIRPILAFASLVILHVRPVLIVHVVYRPLRSSSLDGVTTLRVLIHSLSHARFCHQLFVLYSPVTAGNRAPPSQPSGSGRWLFLGSSASAPW